MGNLNPYYNESFVFVVEQEMLRVGQRRIKVLNSRFSLVPCTSNVSTDEIVYNHHPSSRPTSVLVVLFAKTIQTLICWLVDFECPK